MRTIFLHMDMKKLTTKANYIKKNQWVNSLLLFFELPILVIQINNVLQIDMHELDRSKQWDWRKLGNTDS